MAAVLPVTVTQAASHCRTQMENNKRYETAKSPEITIRTAQRSLYVPYSGHYMYRTVVTICTAQWSLYYMYHPVEHSTILRSAHTVYLCVLCGSENKQRLFPYTALTDWFV